MVVLVYKMIGVLIGAVVVGVEMTKVSNTGHVWWVGASKFQIFVLSHEIKIFINGIQNMYTN